MTVPDILESFRKIISAGGIQCDRDQFMEEVILTDMNDAIPQLDSKLGKSLQKISQQHHRNESSTKGAPQKVPPLMLVILPGRVTKLYHAIKILGDTKLGIHTVCVIGTKADQNSKTSSQNKFEEKKF